MPPVDLHRRALLAGLLGIAGCGARLSGFPFDGAPLGAPAGDDDLHVVFFSVACFVVRWRDVAVLTDPFFTYLPLGRVAFGRSLPDPAASAVASPFLPDVRLVVIGHTHYDHCLDLATVAPRLHADARIVASETAAHLYAASALPRPIDVVNAHLAGPDAPGRWMPHPGGRLRVLPIRSGHPDNVPGIHLWKRQLTEDRTRPPTRAAHYQEGLTLAFLIDWLDVDGSVVWRVFVENSTTGPPAGLVPEAIAAERPVDVALLGMDTANRLADGAPTCLDRIAARRVFLCHWGDFFRPKDRPPREIVKVDLPRLRQVLRARPDGDRFVFPGWDTHHVVRRDA